MEYVGTMMDMENCYFDLIFDLSYHAKAFFLLISSTTLSQTPTIPTNTRTFWESQRIITCSQWLRITKAKKKQKKNKIAWTIERKMDFTCSSIDNSYCYPWIFVLILLSRCHPLSIEYSTRDYNVWHSNGGIAASNWCFVWEGALCRNLHICNLKWDRMLHTLKIDTECDYHK